MPGQVFFTIWANARNILDLSTEGALRRKEEVQKGLYDFKHKITHFKKGQMLLPVHLSLFVVRNILRNVVQLTIQNPA